MKCWLVTFALCACSTPSGSDPGADDGFGAGSGSDPGAGSGSGSGSGSMTTDGCQTGANCVITRVNGVEVSRHAVWFGDPFTRYVAMDDLVEITYEGGGSWLEVNNFVGMPRSPGTSGCLGNTNRGVLFDVSTPATARYVTTQCSGVPWTLPTGDTLTALSITYEFASTSPIRLGGSAHIAVTAGPGLDQGKALTWDLTFHVCASNGAMSAC